MNIKQLLKNYGQRKNISKVFRLQNIGKSYFIEEINQNDLMSKKHKKVIFYIIITYIKLY